MNKKRGSLSTVQFRQGQITIFMILGIVILVVFLFLLSIVNSAQRAKLEAEREEAFESIYPKEGVVLFLDDCLQSSLRDAVAKIEAQGRLWRDLDPGGFIPFEEGKNGMMVDGVPVAYGLTYASFAQYPQAYPCTTEEGFPGFCEYSYPTTSLKFGALALSSSTIEDDLRRYLAAKVVSCAQQLAVEKIAPDAAVDVVNPLFAVTLEANGVAVDATIPFSLVLRGIRYFTTVSLRLFHDTSLRMIVEAAYFPLQADRDYIDFDYDEPTLIGREYTVGSEKDVSSLLGQACVLTTLSEEEYYECVRKLPAGYSSLGVELKKEYLPNKDTLFSFSSPSIKYTFARQNRPPALDYISRLSCPAGEYDYL
ncbi:hypothetical protein HY496_03765, partial [Candidatus Woesearchaeota archaeon]|nr:hypothetical protein [Candidatus Woesearchaeota archaeon]